MKFSINPDPLFEDQEKSYISAYLNIPFLKLSIGLSAGNNDFISVRYIDDRFYVISFNTSLEYLGLEVFNKEGEKCGNVFLQGGEQIEEHFSKKADKILNMSTPWLIKKLQPYAEEY